MPSTRSVPVHPCRFLLRKKTAMVCWGMAWAIVTVTVVAAAKVAGGLTSFLVMTSVLARELRRVDAA